MSDQAPNIEPGKGKLVYNKERRIIVAVPQPLAEEIAGLIERLVSDKALPEERTTAAAMISAALRALAQENERLRQAATRNGALHLLSEQQEREEKHRERIRELEDEIEKRKAHRYEQVKLLIAEDHRIRELEAENNTLRESVNAVRAEYLQRYINALDRADAIRARTTEKCARAAFGVPNRNVGRSDDFNEGYHAGRCDAGEAIRALTLTA